MRRRKKKFSIEKGLMIASAFMIMAALTFTGIYMRNAEQETEEDGYVVDLSSIETKNKQEAELDYDPTYHSSILEEQEQTSILNPEYKHVNDNPDEAGMFREEVDTANQKKEEEVPVNEVAENKAESEEAMATVVQPALNFTEKDTLKWPVVGDVLINYSMDKTVYFPSLDQYKYNPGIVISAAQGTDITAPATGRVTAIVKDPAYGNMVVMDLGNGYQLTCGQLDQLKVSEGSYVNAGDFIGCIGAPTKYFSLEGSNLYLELCKDGTPISPLPQMQ